MSRKKKQEYVTKQLSDNIYMVTLAVNTSPVNKIDRNKKIITSGAKNDFFSYLIDLHSNSTVHGAIVNGKARYLSGIKIKPKEPNPAAEEWLKKANDKESFYEYLQKMDMDEVLSGNEYCLVHPNIIGTPVQFHHLGFAMCRVTECRTQVAYSEDWTDTMRFPISYYPIWKEGMTESAIMVYKRYSPVAKKLDGVYGKPEWIQCLLDVDTECELSTNFNSLVKNNWSVGTIVTIFSGKIPKDKQDAIKSDLLGEGTGTENAGKTVFAFANENGKGAEISRLNANDMDKQYQEVAKRNLQNILIGHSVSGALFKVKVGDTAWTRSDLVEAHELFIKEYVKLKQVRRLNWLKYMYKLRTGQECEFEYEQVETIGIELPLDNQIVVDALNSVSPKIIADYVIEKYNIKIPETLDANGNVVPENTIVQESTNKNITDLKGRQYQGMLRIVRDYDKQKVTRQQAVMLLKSGFGMTDEQAAEFLNENDEDPTDDPAKTQLADQEKYSKFLTLLSSYAHDINLDDEVLDVEYIDHDKVHLATAVTDVRNAILDKLKDDPFLLEKDLAKEIGVDEGVIKESIKWLSDKKLIDIGEGAFTPTEKAIDRETGATKTKIYTEYTYDLAPGVSYATHPNRISDKLLSTSHQFCKDAVAMTATKALTFEAINNMTNDFGENAWQFRGGLTGKKGGGVKVWCNHQWKGTTKISKIKPS